MNPNQNDNFFYEEDEDQFDPQDLTSGGSQQESQGTSQGGMGSQEKTQSSRTGIKPVEKKETDDMTAGKYSFTHDDLVDPDE